MKRWQVTAVVLLAVVMVATLGFGAEVFAPRSHQTGEVGKSDRYWQWGRFQYMNNPRVSIASHDWGAATGTWTLSTAEKECSILVNTNAGAANGVIVAPSETGRIYHVFNRSGYAITIKKSGGNGVSIPNNTSAIVGYFQIGATASTDYYVLASAAFTY